MRGELKEAYKHTSRSNPDAVSILYLNRDARKVVLADQIKSYDLVAPPEWKWHLNMCWSVDVCLCLAKIICGVMDVYDF